MNNNFGYARVAAASPRVHVTNPAANVAEMITIARDAASGGVQVLVYPELGITGYTCGDYFLNLFLQEKALAGLELFMEKTAELKMICAVGLPMVLGSQLFNVAALTCAGKLLALVPKTRIPDYKEFKEKRWFVSADLLAVTEVNPFGYSVPTGTNTLIQAENVSGLIIGTEICEDLWMFDKPSSRHAANGANLLINLSASNELVAKAAYRRNLVTMQSGDTISAYVYASCGPHESTSDVVFSGHCLVAENGSLILDSGRFRRGNQLDIIDVDLDRCMHERMVNRSFADAAAGLKQSYRVQTCRVQELDVRRNFRRAVDPYPFVPSDPATLNQNCEDILSIASQGLITRLETVFPNRCPEVVIGISGGSDSTWAFLVTLEAFDVMGWDRRNIKAITMPGPGTSKETYLDAVHLMRLAGVTDEEHKIEAVTAAALRELGHEPCWQCIRCENAQARTRTSFLMNSGFQIGTGDLSELWMAWCTYNGDHQSMYNVNSGVPKTLIKHLIRWYADFRAKQVELADNLRRTVGRIDSPELIKASEHGEMTQSTEEKIGPYRLHDFDIAGFVRHGQTLRKMFFLLQKAWGHEFDDQTLLRWLREFFVRSLPGQFKRDDVPDGPKVGSVSLSPRSDLWLPSDVDITMWIDEVDRITNAVKAGEDW